jgi:outer membrane biosynthesis protein TonB
MATKIDRNGVFIGKIVDSALSLTKKGFPQWVALLKATKKYIASPEEIAHFQGQGFLQDGQPGWVDWSTFDEEIVAFLVLYNSTEEISPDTELLNVQQLSAATGWQPPAFDTLANLAGQEILFRVEYDSYTNPETGKVSEGYKVTWIDSKDAPPERQLKSLDAGGIATLMQKVVGYGTIGKTAAKPAAPAKPTKPVSAAASPKPATPAVASAPSAPAPAPAQPGNPVAAAPQGTTPTANTSPSTTEQRPVVETTPAAQPSVEKKAARAKKAPAPAPVASPAPPAPAQTLGGLPAQSTMEDAWEYVCNNKGDNEDGTVEDAWLSATSEVAANRDVSELSNADWAKVRDITLKDLAV